MKRKTIYLVCLSSWPVDQLIGFALWVRRKQLGVAAGTVGMTVLVADIGLVGSMVVGSLLGPVAPSVHRGTNSYNNGAAYSWAPATTPRSITSED